MKSVLISIHPKWVEKIANGEKTIEVRKAAPKEVPFKCYIYCTIGNGINGDYLIPSNLQCGKVIGEFICDKGEEFHEWQLSPQGKFQEEEQHDLDVFLRESCLTIKEVAEYRKKLPYYKPLYCWHISDLKIYDKPKGLSEFGQKCDNANEIRCRDCRLLEEWDNCCSVMCKPLTRAPSNWCYVEELEK